jgi:hypothetical protein
MRWLALSRMALALLASAAIGQQLVLHVRASYSVLNFFSYFTNLSNIGAVLVLLLSVLARSGKALDVARYLSAVNMAIVGLVFAVLLRNADLGALLPWVNFVLHYVMPVVLDWLLQPPSGPLRTRLVLLALVFPAIYLAYSIVRGARTGWYAYPFLDPAKAGGAGAVAAYALGIAATFLVLSGVLLALSNRRARVRVRGAGR